MKKKSLKGPIPTVAYLFFIFIITLSWNVNAQTTSVFGTVSDEMNSIMEVTVMVKGPYSGMITVSDDNYEIHYVPTDTVGVLKIASATALYGFRSVTNRVTAKRRYIKKYPI